MRPRLTATRDHDIRVPVTDTEHATLRAAADSLGLGLGTWLREIALRAARRLELGLDGDAPGLPAPEPPEVREARALEARLDAALAEEPRRTDPDIAEELNLGVDIVRRHRQARGIAAVQPSAYASTDWAERITEAHSRGLTNPEIAEATGYTVRTVQQRLSQLRLRAHRRSRAPGAAPE